MRNDGTPDASSGGNSRRGATARGFEPGMDWHTYRLEVVGNTIRLQIDGRTVREEVNNRLISSPGGDVFIYSNDDQINVRSFKVIAL